MKYIDEYRNQKLAQKLISAIKKSAIKKINIMDVCGTHTVAIFKNGISDLLPEEVTHLSGPGCPVCVTPPEDVDKAIELSREKDIIMLTFGDMMKVPGSSSSLEKEKSQGRDIRVVYSALDALEIAQKNPNKKVVFFGVGFETTAPTIATVVDVAREKKIKNFYIISAHKLIPPAMKALLDMGEVKIDGFICPGHVSTIIGSRPYNFIADEYNIPCVIAGFEPIDILQAIYMIITQINLGNSIVEIQYSRSVRPEGNRMAQKILSKVFEKCDASWRGLGKIPMSGLRLKKSYARFDAEKIFSIKIPKAKINPACRCGEILRGLVKPSQCKLFAKACTPEHPVGPCMVSSEGSCAAYYKYGRKH